MLATFAELVQAGGNGPVADLGCGPGRVTEHLHALGLHAFGVDLSPAMVAVARVRTRTSGSTKGPCRRSTFPMARSAASSCGTRSFTRRRSGSEVFAEFHRVLGAGGYLLLAFQAGDACVHLEHAYGHDIELDAYRLSPAKIAAACANNTGS